ncbi:GNAT family N-acetyltransferase [Nocardioides bizhenqiangii]|uniref:GNAT family N-acetyltransferase n=1 Tax=Nocardioides bizhenqiangii TaxID=3095076 RepID=A0ABZ0ZPT6_9ACTN|nr:MULTISPECIES: GNAT family N-acetyltransferase [unclassified Nocardioides]MDZ5621389.1 GNAT family N-acetyltransferase [Nocardioides sp. HM23]WQQ25771.1 GNAT family N-acetyltransferase [Nocardioides sp. HM61]
MTTTDTTRTALEITPVDPFDEDAVVRWVRLTTEVVRHEIGDSGAMWTAPEMIATLQDPPKNRHELIYHGTVDGALVATGWITLPMIDNLNSADLYVAVVPEHRRRGIGSAVLAHLEQVCVERGRTRLDAITDWPYDGAPDGAGAAGVEFGRVHGYSFGLGDVQRELPLPADEDVLAALAAEAAPHHADYELRTWSGPIPDDILQSYLELSSTLATEAPVGDLERDNAAVDIEAHRSTERVLAEQQRVPWHTVALDGEGRVVAYSDLVVPGTDPRWIYQWGTLVDRAHRGHRLGVAVKVANLRAFQSAHPEDRRRIVTWNAEVNTHMIDVNERMGFRATARGGQLQKKL